MVLRLESVTQVLHAIFIAQPAVTALLLSTYSLDLLSIFHDFQTVLGPKSSIPTLILHGEKSDDYEDFQQSLQISPLLSIARVSPQYDNKERSAILGVHHPKYALMFTPSGVHIIISTANLVLPKTTDMSWVHFFPWTTETVSDKERTAMNVGDDFGYILDDLLKQQSNQLKNAISTSQSPRKGTVSSVIEWMQSVVGISSLTSNFDFSSAQVWLLQVNDKQQNDCVIGYSSIWFRRFLVVIHASCPKKKKQNCTISTAATRHCGESDAKSAKKTPTS